MSKHVAKRQSGKGRSPRGYGRIERSVREKGGGKILTCLVFELFGLKKRGRKEEGIAIEGEQKPHPQIPGCTGSQKGVGQGEKRKTSATAAQLKAPSEGFRLRRDEEPPNKTLKGNVHLNTPPKGPRRGKGVHG